MTLHIYSVSLSLSNPSQITAMELYHVYILRCRDDSFYTGVTNNIERRLKEHEAGENITCYTYKRRPVKLEFVEVFGSIVQAIAFEKQVKGWSRAKKQAIIDGKWDFLPQLSKSKSS